MLLECTELPPYADSLRCALTCAHVFLYLAIYQQCIYEQYYYVVQSTPKASYHAPSLQSCREPSTINRPTPQTTATHGYDIHSRTMPQSMRRATLSPQVRAQDARARCHHARRLLPLGGHRLPRLRPQRSRHHVVARMSMCRGLSKSVPACAASTTLLCLWRRTVVGGLSVAFAEMLYKT